jgi:flagellar assembly protein FliH
MTNSSEQRRVVPFAALSASGGFRPSARFGGTASAQTEVQRADPQAEAVALAHAQGFAEGHALAEAEARTMLEAQGRLSLAFERLDQQMEEELRLALREVVAALCEQALAPLASDEGALLARIDKAVAMLSRSYDERTIRLNPQDMALLSDRMRAEWTVVPDPLLPRGSLRVESTEGGIEDSPETWRRAIAEALGAC